MAALSSDRRPLGPAPGYVETHGVIELLEQQLAALIAERDELCAQLAAEKAAYQEMLQHFERLDEDREAELAAAQEWQPVGAADPDIVCEHGTLVQAHGTSIAIGQQVTPDSDELVWTVAELPAGYALCTRQEPPA